MAKVKRRAAKNLDMDHVGHLPDWSTIKSHEDDKYQDLMQQALRHYGYFKALPEMRKSMLKWLEVNVTDAKFIKAYKKSLDWRTTIPAYSLAMADLAGMPIAPDHYEYIIAKVTDAVEAGKADVEVDDKDAKKKAKVNVPSIQDRITAKVNDHILHYEITFEDGIIERGEKHPAPDVRSYLVTENVPASMIDRIVAHFKAQWNEIAESQAKTGNKIGDEQVIEAYAHLTKNDVRRFIDFYKALIVDLEMYKEEKKVARVPRARKAVSKTKQVARIKYLKRHDGLKLVSINPEDIIDAKEVWVYQTKYRKLGKYVAEGYGTLGVKGCNIVGFDVNGSVQKTLRKPKEQLAAFKKAGKVKLRTFMDEVKAVDIKLTGRMNKDTIILKVF